MNTPTADPAAITQQLTELLAKLNPQTAAPAFPGAPAFQQQQAPTFAQAGPQALLVPITLQTQAGDVGCYVQLPAQALANPTAAIAQLQAAGWPVRVYGGAGGGNSGWQSRSRYSSGRRW